MARLTPHHEQTLTPAGNETVKLIRQTRQATRKRYTAEEKIRILMEGLRGEDPVSAICRCGRRHLPLRRPSTERPGFPTCLPKMPLGVSG
jgi:hypothetical protein